MIVYIYSNTLATWCEELTHLKRPWCWERLKVGGEGDSRGWDGWMASPTQWTLAWVSSGSWWWSEAWHAAVHGVTKSWTRLSNGTELNWVYMCRCDSSGSSHLPLPHPCPHVCGAYLPLNIKMSPTSHSTSIPLRLRIRSWASLSFYACVCPKVGGRNI